MHYLFNTTLATDHSVNIAIFLENIKFWILNNLANERNIHDGRCWTYNTLAAFQKLFPFWTKRQLEVIINNAVSANLLVKGNYNKSPYDRTVWYALTEKSYAYFPEFIDPDFTNILNLCISPNCEMGATDLRNGDHQNVTPIPDIKPNTKQDLLKHIGISKKMPDNSEKIIDAEINNLKSKKLKSKVKKSYGLSDLLVDNPHLLSLEILIDWLEVRKNKRNKVTATAWNRINRNLTLIQTEAGIAPIEAFEIMVASGWQSLELKYFLNRSPQQLQSSYKTQWTVDSVFNA